MKESSVKAIYYMTSGKDKTKEYREVVAQGWGEGRRFEWLKHKDFYDSESVLYDTVMASA